METGKREGVTVIGKIKRARDRFRSGRGSPTEVILSADVWWGLEREVGQYQTPQIERAADVRVLGLRVSVTPGERDSGMIVIASSAA